MDHGHMSSSLSFSENRGKLSSLSFCEKRNLFVSVKNRKRISFLSIGKHRNLLVSVKNRKRKTFQKRNTWCSIMWLTLLWLGKASLVALWVNLHQSNLEGQYGILHLRLEQNGLELQEMCPLFVSIVHLILKFEWK